ncbi:MAG: LLM class flavin-dependent oxidoreductase [Actinobacteria bacterium]|nr:LLM class flavin-dependent oxidoreductase [Actinomycetota bacterium]
MAELEFICTIDNPYVYIPPQLEERESVGIDLSTEHYDRDLGQLTLEEVGESVEWLERLGFDGALVFEQHNHPVGLIGNAMVGAAWLASITRGIRICAVGPLINSYATPLRLAEEVALVDNICGGRLTLGLPLGIGTQYHSIGVMNPATARARHLEATELLIEAMTKPGPFAWEGDFFDIPYVNLWPRPLQQPHPPIFLPAAGSRETLEMAARFRFTYQATLTPRPVLLRNCDIFRELCVEHGYEADRKQIACVVPVHVAETDEQARRELEHHLAWRFQNVFRFPFHVSFPPGHVSDRSLRAMMAGGYRSPGNDPGGMSYDEIRDRGLLIAGSPETVIEELAELTDAMGAGRVITSIQGSMPRWMQLKALTLFAQEVIPAFRPPDGLAVWQREERPAYETRTELAARLPAPPDRPTAVMADGTEVDVRTAHLPESPARRPLL